MIRLWLSPGSEARLLTRVKKDGMREASSPEIGSWLHAQGLVRTRKKDKKKKYEIMSAKGK